MKDNKYDVQEHCPYCGSSQVEANLKTGKLKCNYCQKEFESNSVQKIEDNVFNVKGKIISSGAADIDKNLSDIITIKCENCGAEIIIDPNSINDLKCHWCQGSLSINSKINNGMIPDMILPFKISKEDAYNRMKKFIRRRSLFTESLFKKEFTIERVNGVYFPYFIVDGNRHIKAIGKGEHKIKPSERINHKEKDMLRFDTYKIVKEFDIAIKNLPIEAYWTSIFNSYRDNTAIIINSILPFDTDNCVPFQASYLKGYSAEKRDVNTSEIENTVYNHFNDIAMNYLKEDIPFYDNSVEFPEIHIEEVGSQWISAYLPVWLYSYVDKNRKYHYVAVNARTGETRGSAPFKEKTMKVCLFIMCFIIFVLLIFLSVKVPNSLSFVPLLLYVSSIALSIIGYKVRQRRHLHSAKKHSYIDETKYEIKNIKREDIIIKKNR